MLAREGGPAALLFFVLWLGAILLPLEGGTAAMLFRDGGAAALLFRERGAAALLFRERGTASVLLGTNVAELVGFL